MCIVPNPVEPVVIVEGGVVYMMVGIETAEAIRKLCGMCATNKRTTNLFYKLGEQHVCSAVIVNEPRDGLRFKEY